MIPSIFCCAATAGPRGKYFPTQYNDDVDIHGDVVVAVGGDVAGGVGRRLEIVRGEDDGQGAAAALPQAEDAAHQGRRGRVRGLAARTGKGTPT